MNWQPSKCLEDPEEYQRKYVAEETGQGEFALIILNQPILLRRNLFENVWRNGIGATCLVLRQLLRLEGTAAGRLILAIFMNTDFFFSNVPVLRGRRRQ